MALFRALETSRPEARRLFGDPLARSFLGRPLGLVARLGALPGAGRLVRAIVDRRVPGARSSGVARTRYIDDAIARLGGQAEQLVILGAGFDCRAYRLPTLRRLAVFEVDHPDTLAAKRRVLERALGVLPARVRFVPLDFNRGDLASAMSAAGYRPSLRTLFLWEGVTNYLNEAAVDGTLRWCARAAAGSRLLFTYVHARVLADPDAFVGAARLFASLARFGERWTFGIEPGRLSAFLAESGLSLESDLGASEYRELYYGGAAREMRGYEFYRIAVARVGGPADASGPS